MWVWGQRKLYKENQNYIRKNKTGGLEYYFTSVIPAFERLKQEHCLDRLMTLSIITKDEGIHLSGTVCHMFLIRELTPPCFPQEITPSQLSLKASVKWACSKTQVHRKSKNETASVMTIENVTTSLGLSLVSVWYTKEATASPPCPGCCVRIKSRHWSRALESFPDVADGRLSLSRTLVRYPWLQSSFTHATCSHPATKPFEWFSLIFFPWYLLIWLWRMLTLGGYMSFYPVKWHNSSFSTHFPLSVWKQWR